MTDAAQSQERRAYTRHQVRTGLLVEHAGRQYRGQIENISLGGTYAAVPAQLPVGAEAALVIPLPGGEFVLARAEVVRSRTGWAGLRFLWAGADAPNRLLLQEALGG